MRLARLGARLNIFFLFPLDRTKQAIHAINRATYTRFASINPSDIKSGKFISMNRVPANIESNNRQLERNTRNNKGFSCVGKNGCTCLFAL